MRLNNIFTLKQLIKLIPSIVCCVGSALALVLNANLLVLSIIMTFPFIFIMASTWKIVLDIQSGMFELKMAAGYSKITYILNFLGVKFVFNLLVTLIILIIWSLRHNQPWMVLHTFMLIITLFILGWGITLKTALSTHNMSFTASIGIFMGSVMIFIIAGISTEKTGNKAVWVYALVDLALILAAIAFILWSFKSKWARWTERTISDDANPNPTPVQIIYRWIAGKVKDLIDYLE